MDNENVLIQFQLPDLKPKQWNDFIKFLQPTIDKIQNHLLERARANAPIKTGALRKSLFVEPIIENGVLSFDCGSPKEYALKKHEEVYQLGPTSKTNEQTVEGSVGNKYFTRVIDYWYDTYADWIEEAVIQYLQKEFTRS